MTLRRITLQPRGLDMKIIAIATLALLVSASAPYAQTATHLFSEPAPSILHLNHGIDMNQVIVDMSGDPFKDGSVQPPEPKPADWKPPSLTLGRAIGIVSCNDRVTGEDAHEAGIDKARRCQKAWNLVGNKDAVLTTDMVTAVELRIGGLPPIVGVQVIKAIAPQDLETK